jgi:hypothetical protein
MMFRVILVACLLACWPTLLLADSLTVSDMAFGTGIQDKAVTGVDTVFDVTVERIYCWNVVRHAAANDTIYHTWYLNGNEIQKVPLPVKGFRYRTHSFKSLWGSLSGVWTVKVTDLAGNLLAEESVDVRKAVTEEEPTAETREE